MSANTRHIMMTALTFGLVLAIGMIGTAHAGRPGAKPIAQSSGAAITLPALPDPVAVTLDPATTAYFIGDVTTYLCGNTPTCPDNLVAIEAILQQARANNVFTIYTLGSKNPVIVSDVAPQDGDLNLGITKADKFYGNDLDGALQANGIKTIIMVGFSCSGFGTYTTYEANLRGYQVVVPEDACPGSTPFTAFYSYYQMLHEPSFGNADNNPLGGGATLTMSNLITFQPGTSGK